MDSLTQWVIRLLLRPMGWQSMDFSGQRSWSEVAFPPSGDASPDPSPGPHSGRILYQLSPQEAQILGVVAPSFSADLPDPGVEPGLLIAGGFFPS